MSIYYKFSRPIALLFMSSVIILTFTFSTCNTTQPLNMSEVDGLKATINSISRIDSTSIGIEYKLEWGNTPGGWILNPTEPINFYYWDVAGQRLDSDDQFENIFLEEGFISQTIKTNFASVSMVVPSNAVEVSIELGNSGLETKRSKIP